jgi:hypothetical protein
MFGIDHAELGAIWLRENDVSYPLADIIEQHENPEKISRRHVLANTLVSSNHLMKQIGIGYSGNPVLDPRPWEEQPATVAMFEARGNRAYDFGEFALDILNQFENFPDLL